MDAKMAHATKLRNIYGFAFDVAVDDIDGTLHRAMSPKPNSAYVLAPDGTILFRAQWANDTQALATALEAVVGSQAPLPSESAGFRNRPSACCATSPPFLIALARGRGRICGSWRRLSR
jgi:hypothetical protein